MADNVTATFIVQYKSTTDTGSTILVEVDEDYHQDSTFAPGSVVNFRIYANCSYDMVLSDRNSSVSSNGSGVKNVEKEEISFVQTKTSSLSYIYNSGWSFSWFGSPGRGSTSISVPSAPSNNKTEINISTSLSDNDIVAIGRVNYNSNYSKFKFNPSVSEEGFSAIILIRET